MPKKTPRNSFYFYMIDFKEEQRKKGINYNSMIEVSTAAGSVWPTLSPRERAKYEAMAKTEKQKYNVPEMKFTSTGIPIAHINQIDQEKVDAEEAELKDIRNIVKLKAFDNRILDEDIYLMDVNFYCKASGEYIIGESTVLRFNLKDGIRDNYHVVVNPGTIPIGYGYEVKLGSKEYGLEMPDEGAPRTNFMEILANIIDYLKQKDNGMKDLPPIFTMPDKVAPVMNFIQQMCSRAGEDDTLFRVYKLDTLFFTMANALKVNSGDGFPRESLALAQLKKDPFKYSPELGCEMHKLGEKSVECSKSRATRWAFTVLDRCCPLVGVDAVPGQHLPHDFHVFSITSFKEQTRTRVGSHVARASSCAGGSAASSCNTTLTDLQPLSSQPLSSQPLSPSADSANEKKRNPPLRMPTADYVPAVRLGPAPLVSEEDFPPLLGAGRGRRNLSNKLNKMNMQN